MKEKNFIVVKTHVTSGLTEEHAYLLAIRFRRLGYGSEILTVEEFHNQDRARMQDLTPFEKSLGIRQEAPDENIT